MAEKYLPRSRRIKADYSIERSDFLGSRLALLDKIIQASIASKQHQMLLGLKAQRSYKTAGRSLIGSIKLLVRWLMTGSSPLVYNGCSDTVTGSHVAAAIGIALINRMSDLFKTII